MEHPNNPTLSAERLDQLVNWSVLEDATTIQSCRDSLLHEGVMTLPNFATADGLEDLKSEVLSCPYNEMSKFYTSYQDLGDIKYPEDHPRNFKTHSSQSFVGRKSLENLEKKLCISLFNDDRLLSFVSKVASRELYRSKDENGSVYSYVIRPHHDPLWHFDESPYTAILYLQNSEGGGEFEYVPWCREKRTPDDEGGHEVIRKVLMENGVSNNHPYEKIKQVDVVPGSLIFFLGTHSFHRAAPITGTTPRVGLVFTFSDVQDFQNSESVKQSNEWDPADATRLVSSEQ